jgi:hypothetical protein
MKIIVKLYCIDTRGPSGEFYSNITGKSPLLTSHCAAPPPLISAHCAHTPYANYSLNPLPLCLLPTVLPLPLWLLSRGALSFPFRKESRTEAFLSFPF